jgi:hypothetical protein
MKPATAAPIHPKGGMGCLSPLGGGSEISQSTQPMGHGGHSMTLNFPGGKFCIRPRKLDFNPPDWP